MAAKALNRQLSEARKAEEDEFYTQLGQPVITMLFPYC
jgi:hypothetical protein